MLDVQNGQPMGHGSGNATGYNHGRNQVKLSFLLVKCYLLLTRAFHFYFIGKQ